MAKPSIKHISSNSGNVFIQSEIKQWGNSLGVRIPKEIRSDLNLFDGSKIIISLNRKNKKIIIENSSQNLTINDLAKDFNLSDLTKKITKKNKPEKEESLFGIVGKEVW